jgi:hypothetical protein
MSGKTTTRVHAKPNYALHRHEVGAPVPADSTDLDALYSSSVIPPGGGAAVPTKRRDILDCEGWESITVYVRLAGGTTPTVDLVPLEQVLSADSDGAAIDELAVDGAATGALSDRDSATVTVNGGRVFLRFDAITGAPTAVDIYVAGAKRLAVEHGSRRAI